MRRIYLERNTSRYEHHESFEPRFRKTLNVVTFFTDPIIMEVLNFRTIYRVEEFVVEHEVFIKEKEESEVLGAFDIFF